METLQQPWPWWAAGIAIGLTVPALLILGNKHFGLSANLRHACAACFPGSIKFFKYDWKKESWNLFFALGTAAGAFLASTLLANPEPIQIAPSLASDLQKAGITQLENPVPVDLFSWSSLLSLRGFLFMVGGGFLIGFGSRYAGGCTSGHAIMGLSTLQWPSLVATCCFMVGGFATAQWLVPFLLTL